MIALTTTVDYKFCESLKVKIQRKNKQLVLQSYSSN